ncbi:hypothetical protein NHQ30_003659 [Ciborinia camelliae]|nr:hypothetical protein NHQ30_003659 [Ciborinia camelliae]
MPNWKTYEATVRLLSAIVAAHPGLKLDYTVTSKYYGDESNYHQIWSRMRGIQRNSEQLRKAVEAGINPSTITLEDDVKVKKEISPRFGGDCTVSALENRFRRLKSDATLINTAIASGKDPISINVGDTNGLAACKSKKGELSQLMGSETPASHIQSQYRETFKPLAERLLAMRDAGQDCKNVDLTDLGNRRYKAGQELLSMFYRSSSQMHIALSPFSLCLNKIDIISRGCQVHGLRCHCCSCRDAVSCKHQTSFSRRQTVLVKAGRGPKDVLVSPKGGQQF